jgi:hypothetical protein
VNDESLRSAYTDLLTQRAGPRSECVSPEALLRVAEGTAPEAERLATLRHVGACRPCRAELELLRTAGDVAQRVARSRWHGRRLLAAAAGVMMLAGSVALWLALRPPAADTLRDGAPTRVQLLAPAEEGTATPPVTLVWAAVPAALRYEVEVLRPDGSAAFIAEPRDTTVVVPVTAALAPGFEYRWWVRAVLPDGTRLHSPIGRLRVATP